MEPSLLERLLGAWDGIDVTVPSYANPPPVHDHAIESPRLQLQLSFVNQHVGRPVVLHLDVGARAVVGQSRRGGLQYELGRSIATVRPHAPFAQEGAPGTTNVERAGTR